MSFHICQAVRFQALQNACKQNEKKKSAIDHQKYSRLANGVQNHQHRSWHYVCIPAMMRRAFCWICHTEFDPLKVWLKGLLQIDLSHSKINRKGMANITKQSKLTLTVKFLHAFLSTVQVFPRKKGISVRATICTLVLGWPLSLI